MENQSHDVPEDNIKVSRADTPPIDFESEEELSKYDTPTTLLKYKTSPNPFTRSFSDDSVLNEVSIPCSFNLSKNANGTNYSESGSCLIIIFETSDVELVQARIKSRQLEKILTFLNFTVKIVDTTELKDERLLSVTKKSVFPLPKIKCIIEEEISGSISSDPNSSLVVFLIGQAVTEKESRGILSYKINEGTDSQIYTHRNITSKFVTALSTCGSSKPVLLFFNYISQPNSPLTPEKNVSANTFFCYSSTHISALPEVRPHLFVLCLFEAIKELPMTSQLTHLFIQTRDKYYNSLASCNDISDSKDILFVQNTLRKPLYFQRNHSYLNSEGKSDNTPTNISQGLFMLLTNENFVQNNKFTFLRELIDKIKKEFELMNYKIAQDILLVGKSSYSQTLSKNKSLCQNCSSVVVLILTCDQEPHQVSLNDKTFLKIHIFSNELANSFPDLPRVIFLSQIVSQNKPELVKKPLWVNSSSLDYLQLNYQNMLVVHSIDRTMSGINTSLLANFILALQTNYFAELHSILQRAIYESHRSEFIQCIDGIKRNFHFSLKKGLSSILSMENEKFKKAYEMACIEGSEPFRFYRLMIVGPEGVGKTSLLRYLTGLPFQIDQESTPFLNKFDLQVHKISQNWDQIEDLSTYASNLEGTRQDMAVKYMTQGLLASNKESIGENDEDSNISEIFDIPVSSLSSEHTPHLRESIFEVDPSEAKVSSSQEGECEFKEIFANLEENYPGEESTGAVHSACDYISSIPIEKIHSTLSGSDELTSKSDFLTAWDFAGQNYLYCFHSLFLSPRAIYLLIIDLTVEDLTLPIKVRRERRDRLDLRSQIGVPTTYLEAMEFWLNAIFSVSKTSSTDIYQRPAKILFVFSKSDLVSNPRERAEEYFETIRSHMNKRNNSFSLVHEDDGLFLISCLAESPYSAEISNLKDVIKRLSDQIAFQQSIPIKWIELAKVILREEQPILNYKRIYYLAESCHCANDLEHFLYLFHDIGFFFFKQGKIIKDVQKFLDIIYHIVSPQYGDPLIEYFPNKDTELLKRDLKMCQDKAKLSINLFECILKSLNLYTLKESIIELLRIYGILIYSQSEQGITKYFYVPYLLTSSFSELSSSLPKHAVIASFYIYFPDGFIPASLYFTLLSDCIRRNEEKGQPAPILGFDCAYFHICSSFLVAIDFTKSRPYIQVVFSKIVSPEKENSFTDQYVKSEMMDYLIFLQILIVNIQGKLIPCGNLAKIVLDCTCGRLSEMEQMEYPCTCLDQLLLTNPRARESWCYNKQCKVEWNHFFNDNDFLLDYMTKFYDNTSLARFIFTHQDIFITHINFKDLSPLLYKFGLITSERAFAISNKINTQANNSASLLEELVHKGPLWAVKFYVVLCREYTNPGHQFLRSLIDKNISTGLIRPLSMQTTQNIDLPRSHDRYRMNSNPHGIAFLVNIESFSADQAAIRKGSKLDLISLREAFEQLQYIVMARENVTRGEFKKEINKIARMDHSSYDSFFCVVMSHGDENDNILLSDGRKISRDEITSEFSNIYCKSLAGKPKIFILQACRGSKIEVVHLTKRPPQQDYELSSRFGRKLVSNKIKKEDENNLIETGQLHPTIQPLRGRLTSAPSIDEEPENLSELSDIFIGNSTVQRYSSFRDTSHGSIFIQSFCLVLQYCRYEEFMHIMTEVRRRVSLLSLTYTQCTEDVSHLRKKLYF